MELTNGHRQELPEGWCMATLEQSAELVNGSGFPLNYQGQQGLELPFFKVGSLGEVESGEYLKAAKDTIDVNTARHLRAAIVPPNAVLFAKIGMAIRLNRRRLSGLRCCIDNNMMAAVPSNAIIPEYLLRYLETLDFMGFAQATTVPSIRKSELASVPIPLPPLAEQERIIAKAEELLGRVKATRTRLFRVSLLISHLRTAVLTAACSGRLTEAWRGTAAAVPSSENGASEDSQVESLFNLPSSWRWVSFESVCEDITVGHVGPMIHEYKEDGIPFLRSQNVREFRFDPSGLKYISRQFHLKLSKSALRPGDVAVVRSGYAGTACVIPDSIPEANCADLVIIRPSAALDPHYACIFINSSTGRAHVNEVKVGIAQSHFNIGAARKTPLPLPPLAEQREIVRQVSTLLSGVDKVEGRTASTTASAGNLTQAILTKAFRGELVLTEAELARRESRNYEPASALLERIRAEGENKTKSPSASKRKPKNFPAAVEAK
jgi:type I restriction enzyme, S subunit